MNEVISIRIIRPHFDGLSDADKKLMIEGMAKDIANQIFRTEETRMQQADLAFWQNYLLRWHLEDQARRRDY